MCNRLVCSVYTPNPAPTLSPITPDYGNGEEKKKLTSDLRRLGGVSPLIIDSASTKRQARVLDRKSRAESSFEIGPKESRVEKRATRLNISLFFYTYFPSLIALCLSWPLS